ncbi:MAG: ACP S-malonyltransferase [Candidatus Hydrothermae bacterium]|nr:ACP S-malonyltransferase [Candidatus Hydrothermae bacterium]
MHTIWMFPGQGAQKVGMLRAFYEENARVRRWVDAADAMAPFPLKSLMFEGPQEALTDTRVAQPALFVAGYGVADVLRAQGQQPDAVLGHSLGELTAYAVAGVWTFEEGFQAVLRRGELMGRAGDRWPGTMAAVIGLDRDKLETLLADEPRVVIANENTPSQLVISGDREALEGLLPRIKKAGARRVVPLQVSAAFHSPLMEEAAREYAAFLDQLPFRPPACPIIVNPTGKLLQDPEALRASLRIQLRSPVRFTTMLATAYQQGARQFVELGVGRVLCGLVGKTLREVSCRSIQTPEDLQEDRT